MTELELAVKQARQAALLCVLCLAVFLAVLLVDHQNRRKLIEGLQGVNRAAGQFAGSIREAAGADIGGTGYGTGRSGNSPDPDQPRGNDVARVDADPAGGTADYGLVNGQRGAQVAGPGRETAGIPGDE